MKNLTSLIKTDLIIEMAEILTSTSTKSSDKINTKNKNNNKNKESNLIIDGVELLHQYNKNNIDMSWIKILNHTGEKNMGKPIGNYITIESSLIKENNPEAHKDIINIFSEQLSKLFDINKNSSILIIGLGNWNVTPDALGPKVISKILVTRHIKDFLPDDINNNISYVSAVSTGVMGTTGIETAEIVKGIVEKIKPDLVIAIDALASRKTTRINTTIQMTDTGISPGAGMGNKRKALNKDTLGVPVIAIGVPTVVDVGTLVNDTIDILIDSIISQVDEQSGKDFYKMLKNIDKQEKYNIITEALNNIANPQVQDLFVTPKEVDEVVERLARIISMAINKSMHKVDITEISKYID